MIDIFGKEITTEDEVRLYRSVLKNLEAKPVSEISISYIVDEDIEVTIMNKLYPHVHFKSEDSSSDYGGLTQ